MLKKNLQTMLCKQENLQSMICQHDMWKKILQGTVYKNDLRRKNLQSMFC